MLPQLHHTLFRIGRPATPTLHGNLHVPILNRWHPWRDVAQDQPRLALIIATPIIATVIVVFVVTMLP
jgi:hypothetical protein